MPLTQATIRGRESGRLYFLLLFDIREKRKVIADSQPSKVSRKGGDRGRVGSGALTTYSIDNSRQDHLQHRRRTLQMKSLVRFHDESVLGFPLAL